jgi:hypothetical protein
VSALRVVETSLLRSINADRSSGCEIGPAMNTGWLTDRTNSACGIGKPLAYSARRNNPASVGGCDVHRSITIDPR